MHTPEQLRALASALDTQRQADEDGVFVAVSRQACDEAAAILRAHADALASPPPAEPAAPTDMILHCPACGMQHIDAPEWRYRYWPKEPIHGNAGEWRTSPTKVEPSGSIAEIVEWTNPPHRSHKCNGCGHIWRPADVATNGAAAIKTKGKNDSPPAAPQQQPEAAPTDAELEARTGWPPGMLQDDSRELSKALASKPDAMRHAREAAEMIKDAPAEPGELPPMPAKRWAMYCTKCRYSGGIERPTEKCAACPKCGYCGFAQELDYSSDEMRAYARLALATSPLPRERGEKIMDAALAWRTASYVEREAAEASLRAILEGRA